MSAVAPDHLGQVRQLRTLAGAIRPTDALLADMLTGARRSVSILEQLQMFPIRTATLQDLELGVEGLRRSIAELKLCVKAPIAEVTLPGAA